MKILEEVGAVAANGNIVAQRKDRVKPHRGNSPRRQARRQRRQQHGSAWHWKQTNSWYYTPPSTKRRVPLFDDEGRRIRGVENKQAAQLALARVKLGQGWKPDEPPPDEWIVAKVCSEYIQYCERALARASMSRGHHEMSVRLLNDFCRFCGALPVRELKKGHLRTWIDQHQGWKSQVTIRNTITIVQAAFNYCQDNHEVSNPLKGFKKPASQPRLHSLSAEDEKALYGACDPAFKDFLFAAIHTGLRPFCELAKLTADEVEELPRGMMWKVYSSKTKKTRKIPIREEVAKLVRKLLMTAPAGSGVPLFRSPRGRAWTKVNGVHRIIAAKKKLGWMQHPTRKHYSCYTCRHTFAHRMLSGYWNNHAGCSIETLAELMGDTPKVAYDHYGKEWGQHYQEPLWAAVGGSKQVTKPKVKAKKHTPRKPR